MHKTLWLLLLALLPAAPGQAQSFLLAGTYAVGKGGLAGAVAIGDMNQDGRPDLVVACYNAPPDAAGHLGPALAYSFSNWQSVGILLQQPDGTFAPVVRYSLGRNAFPSHVVVSDFNHDHYPDVAVSARSAAEHGVMVLLNRRDGTLAPPVDYTTGQLTLPAGLVVGDVNADGHPDLVTANSNRATVSVLLGRSDGTFALGPTYPATGIAASDVALADTNQDGHPDIVVAGGVYNGGVGVLLNQRDGTFAPITTYASSSTIMTEAVATGDVNHDGYPDLVVGGTSPGRGIGVLLNQHDGTFGPYHHWAAGRPMGGGLTTADFDGDGYADLAMADAEWKKAGILLSRPQGEATAFNVYPLGAGEGGGVAVGDLNRDGAPDVVGVANYDGTITVLLNQTARPRAGLPAAAATGAGQPEASLYPNPAPAAGPVPVLAVTHLPAAVHTLEITLLTASGQQVSQLVALASQQAAYSKIPVVGLATGVYVLRLAAYDAQGHATPDQLPALRLAIP